MITAGELKALGAEWQLRLDIVEKDYCLGWMLAAIASDPELSQSWIFKGGTCLRKCYYETYRFSEDLDFSIVEGGPEEPADLIRIFGDVSEWLAQNVGIEIEVGKDTFKRRQNRRGKPTTEGRVAFRGPNRPRQMPKIKLDLTSDEALVEKPVQRQIFHSYSDTPLPVDHVLCYPIEELLAEKIRAFAERCRPRDLYDVVNIYRHPDLVDRPAAVLTMLEQKCEHAGIEVPTAKSIQDSPFRQEIEQEWDNMLAHQLPHLPPFLEFWDALNSEFVWLHGEPVSTPARLEIEQANADPLWTPPATMSSWSTGAPLELIRFAGANRLKVMLDYRAEEGNQGPRAVEPYSLRRGHDGNLLLYLVYDRGEPRFYRVDRIAGAQVLDESFTPRYLVEF